MWKDRQWRINILVASPFILAVVIAFGLNVYKHIHYSTFTLVVKGNYSVTSGKAQMPVQRNASSDNVTSLLHTAWWGTKPNYDFVRNDNKGAVYFVGYPTIRGNLQLQTPIRTWGNLATATLIVEGLNGERVDVLRPNHWYRVGEEKPYAVLEFHWGK